jgi:GGDEF domain-containing protein
MDKPVQFTTSASLSSVVSPGRLGAALARAVDIASEHRCSMSLIAIAIDNTAAQEVRYGLSVEQLEQQVSNVLMQMLRNIDVIGHRSDGGFLIITAPAFHFEGQELATRLTKAIKNLMIEELPELTLSCGVAAYQPDDTATSFYERALAALARSQAQGGGCTVADEVDESTFSP